jgi:hypothetical protein
VLALGVWPGPEGRAGVDAVSRALEAGYRQIDAAQGYGTSIADNGVIFDFELAASDVELLDGLDRTSGTGSAQERKWWWRRPEPVLEWARPVGRAAPQLLTASRRRP